ncbi:MAG: hypothetical protein HY922_03190 [Elusimicrobia bacterium]|nr:hypothetical protein [Elusimicrobiota bacterium]
MTRIVIGAVLLSLVIAAPVFAAESAPEKPAQAAKPKAKSGLKWFKQLMQGLQKSAVEGHHRKVRISAVASVRGEPQEKSKGLYWKGSLSEKQAAQYDKERQEFAAAVELIIAGKLDEGGAKLDAFEGDHPKSKLLKEVQDARRKLQDLKKQDPAGEKGAETAPAVEEKKEAPAQAPENK